MCKYAPTAFISTACVCPGVPPCACHYRVQVHFTTVCLSLPCAFPESVHVPLFACPFCVYIPPIVFSIVCTYVGLSVCPTVCMSPLCMSRRMFVPSSVCSSRMYVLSMRTIRPNRVYVQTRVCPSECMFLRPPYVCSQYIWPPAYMSPICMFPYVCMYVPGTYVHSVRIHSTHEDFRFCNYACSLGSAKRLKLLDIWLGLYLDKSYLLRWVRDCALTAVSWFLCADELVWLPWIGRFVGRETLARKAAFSSRHHNILVSLTVNDRNWPSQVHRSNLVNLSIHFGNNALRCLYSIKKSKITDTSY